MENVARTTEICVAILTAPCTAERAVLNTAGAEAHRPIVVLVAFPFVMQQSQAQSS